MSSHSERTFSNSSTSAGSGEPVAVGPQQASRSGGHESVLPLLAPFTTGGMIRGEGEDTADNMRANDERIEVSSSDSAEARVWTRSTSPAPAEAEVGEDEVGEAGAAEYTQG